MGFFDSFGEAVGKSLKNQIETAQSTSERAGGMSDERLEREAKRAIKDHDYAKMAAYSKEYNDRKKR